MPRSCEGKLETEESHSSRGESKQKAHGTKREPKLEKEGKWRAREKGKSRLENANEQKSGFLKTACR